MARGMKRLAGTLIMALLLYFDVGGLWAVVRVLQCCWESEDNGKVVRSELIFHEVCSRDILHKPVHYESQVPFDWAQMLRDNYHVILEELASDDFPLVPINELDEGNAYLNEDDQWKALYFIINGYPTKISKKFPRTMALLAKTPLFVAFISRIEGGKSLSFHRGTSQMAIRYHLALQIPEGEPRPFMVILDDEQCTVEQAEADDGYGCPGGRYNPYIPNCYSIECTMDYLEQEKQKRKAHVLHWRDGDDLAFDDMFEHAVVNENPGHRMILFADYVRHDCPFFLNYFMDGVSWWWVANFVERVYTLRVNVEKFDYDPRSWMKEEEHDGDEEQEEGRDGGRDEGEGEEL